LLVPPLPTGVNEIPSSAEYKLRLDEHKKSVEGETLQTVERLLSKVSDGESPLKFPLPIANNYTMLTVDIRSLFSEHVDRADLDHIAYGANAVPIEYRLYWQSREGRLCPLRGIFDPANNLQKAKHFQERVHFLTFLIEKSYGRTELSKIGYYVANPCLFDSHESAMSALSTFPLISKEIQLPIREQCHS
jgi:hypothetical protein